MNARGVAIDAVRCIRCGACASLAPRVFAWRDGAYVVVQQPGDDGERELADAALVNCPSLAIGVDTR